MSLGSILLVTLIYNYSNREDLEEQRRHEQIEYNTAEQ
jgi:hypothetical protein